MQPTIYPTYHILDNLKKKKVYSTTNHQYKNNEPQIISNSSTI